MNLSSQRCFNHPARPVVFRCPECSRFYCRECASSFQDRFLCKTCLDEALSVSEQKSSSLLRRFTPGLGFICGFLLLWFLFHGLGQVLYILPEYVHSGLISHEKEK